jgi:hypothetical protein
MPPHYPGTGQALSGLALAITLAYLAVSLTS